MNPEPGFQSGPGDSVDADYMEPFLLVTKSIPPSGGSEKVALALPFLCKKSFKSNQYKPTRKEKQLK